MAINKSQDFNKGFTLVEVLISLGLIFIMVFAVSALALGFSRYQTSRLERSLVQENFRYAVSIITEDIQNYANDILNPQNDEISFKLCFLHNDVTTPKIIVFQMQNFPDSTESQVFRNEYHVPFDVDITQDNYQDYMIDSYLYEEEPISDKIRAISNLVFHYGHYGITIFMTGEIPKIDFTSGRIKDKLIISYVSFVFPRN